MTSSLGSELLGIERHLRQISRNKCRNCLGLRGVALLVGCAKPVPAFRLVGVAALCRIDHEARLLLDYVHSRTMLRRARIGRDA